MITNSGQIDSWLDRYESKWTILSSARISRSLEEYYEVVKGVDNLSKSVKRRKKRLINYSVFERGIGLWHH